MQAIRRSRAETVLQSILQTSRSQTQIQTADCARSCEPIKPDFFDGKFQIRDCEIIHDQIILMKEYYENNKMSFLIRFKQIYPVQ